MPFKDHFSGHAVLYRDARPLPPADWFDWLAGQSPDLDLAWDAGCGNGQASVGLAGHFARVMATDPSATQIGQATPHACVAQYLAYLESWSATRRHLARTGVNPVQAAKPALEAAWGDPQCVRVVRWPFQVRVGQVS